RELVGLALHQRRQLLQRRQLEFEHRRERPDLGRQVQVGSREDEGSAAAAQHRREIAQAAHDRGVAEELVQVLEEVEAVFPPRRPARGDAETVNSGCANGTTSCSQTVPAAGVATSTRYRAIASSAHADRKSDVCPQPWTVSRLELGSREWAVTAPSYRVAGSKRLPTTSTGFPVRRSNGPVKRSPSAPGQSAQML